MERRYRSLFDLRYESPVELVNDSVILGIFGVLGTDVGRSFLDIEPATYETNAAILASIAGLYFTIHAGIYVATKIGKIVSRPVPDKSSEKTPRETIVDKVRNITENKIE